MISGTPTLKGKEPSIRKIYIPSDEERDVLKHVYERYYRMKDARSKYEGLWDKWEKQWNAWRPEKAADDWRSNIYIPLTTSIIEAQLSEVIEQTLRPWVVERGSEDTSKAKIINSILDYTWEIAKSDVALFEMIKDALIFGTGIGMEYFWKQPRTIKEGKKEHKVLEFDNCYLEPVRLQDFYVDEKARGFTGPQQAQDCIRRYVMDYDDFRTFFTGENWDPFDAAKMVKPGGDVNYYEFFKPPERLDHSREVEVLWYWNKPDDRLAVVANDVLVVDKPNPYKHKQLPFVRVTDVKVPYQFYGKGECELLESLQEETNTIRRMLIDRNHLDIDKPILTSDTLTIEDEDTITRPHGVIPVGDVSQVKVMEYNDVGASVFKGLEMLNDDKIRVTGMDERMQGVNTGGTATEAAILKESTLKRLNMKMWQMKNDTLIDIGRLRVENIIQFYSQPKLEAIVGEDAVAKAKQDKAFFNIEGQKYRANYRQIRLKDQKFDINPTTKQPDIKPSKGFSFFEAKPEFFLPTHGGYDVKYLASASIPLSKPLQQQKADEMYDRLVKNPAVDPWKLAEYLLKSRELNADDFKAQPQGQPQGGQIDLQKIMDMASVENADMMEGKSVGPTPYAPKVHTEAHIEFMNSERFKKEAPEEIMGLFISHVSGEIKAQQQRGEVPAQGMPGMQQGGGMPQQQLPNGQASMQDVMPNMVSGGGQTPNISGAQSQ